MHLYLWVAALFVILATARAQSESKSRPIGYEIPLSPAQCGCRKIQSKLDQQDQRISEMLNQQKKEMESILNGMFAKLDQLEQRVSEMIIKHENNKTESVTKLDQLGKLENRVSQMLEWQQNDSVILEELKQVIRIDEGKESALQNLTQQSVVDASSNLTGSLPTVKNVSVQYVDTQFGPNWIVILQRIDDSDYFARPWKDYRDGFGTVGQNFWLGLENMHQLTKDSPYELAVEMTDFYHVENRYARYDRFEIGSEEQEYPIVKLGTHSGSAGDGLINHKFITFSTYDSGKDIAVSKKFDNAGWWFYQNAWDSCFTCGKNTISEYKGMWWFKFKTGTHLTKLSSARMMIRAI